MLKVEIPGTGFLDLAHFVTDFSGTLFDEISPNSFLPSLRRFPGRPRGGNSPECGKKGRQGNLPCRRVPLGRPVCYGNA